MKTLKKSSRGMALVLTLAFLALLGTLVVVFLFSSRSTRGITKGYATGVILQTLADSTLNLATSQITQATMDAARGSSSETTALDPSKRYAWASQPGLIRTFRGSASGPLPVRAYKLYSSDVMLLDGVWDPNAQMNTEVPANWESQPAVYTDLNEPVRAQDGTLTYPILPARAVASTITGFALSGAARTNAGGDGIAMPVRWLYTLADGNFAAIDANGIVPGASATNPIVGRIAFWTDDDSSKLNINTASEGTYWDTPFNNAPTEYDFARYQPAQGEYQRYAGHPSTVSLSPVLNAFGFTTPKSITDLIPRVVDADNDSGRGTRRSTQISPTDTDRLYATLDELAFKPDRTTTGLTQAQIQQLRFFLTTQSRAPELNLFHQPRVTIWPGNTGSFGDATAPGASSNPRNRLIAFCSRIGSSVNVSGVAIPRRYDFVRTRGSQPNERYQEARRTNLNWTRFSRNRQLYAYLQRLTSVPPPIANGSFRDKYTEAERDQILTQIYDYIRGLTNLNQFATGGSVAAEHYALPTSDAFGGGQIVPSKIVTIAAPAANPTTGMGRFPFLTEFALCFTSVNSALPPADREYELTLLAEPFMPSPGYVAFNYNHLIQISGLQNLKVDGVSVFAIDTIRGRLQGKMDISGDFSLLGSFTGPAGWRICYRNMDPVGGGENTRLNSARFKLPTGAINFTQTGPLTVEIRTPSTAANPNANIWDPNELIQTVNFQFPNSTVTAPWPAPIGNAPFSLRTRLGDTNPKTPSMHSSGRFIRDNDNDNSQHDPAQIRDTDTVRSVQIRPDSPFADFRLLALTSVIPATAFAPVDAATYFSGNKFSHSLRGGSISDLYDSAMFRSRAPHRGAVMTGALVANTTHNPFAIPAVSAGLNGALMSSGAPGDWDSGLAIMPDGAYFNKPDEGNNEATTAAVWSDRVPFFASNFLLDTVGVTFSPNRHLPSAVMFGSLPTGVRQGLPWQTLLFCPNSAATVSGGIHPGAADPADSLLLDLFRMPVVDPYAISEPFSTDGKINMNSQIAPFTYIQRDTALHGVLKPLKISAVSDSDSAIYKGPRHGTDAVNASSMTSRYDVDATRTLDQFRSRFAANQPFVSPSEICSIPLVPVGHTGAPLSFWTNKSLTGDNLRERPYVDLYPKLTTQSNTYTVHMRVESLQKVPTSPADSFVAGRDQVTGEWRGSYTVERFIDPDDTRFVGTDTAGTNPNVIDPDFEALTPAYQWRTILSKRFQP